MARMIVRRSLSSLAAKRCMAPAPRSKPSRRTYTAIINATKINQAVSTVPPFLGRNAFCRFQCLLAFRTVGDLAHHEHDVEEAHDQVHPREPYEREQHAARGDEWRDTLRSSEDAVGEPWLASELRCEPPCGVRDEREWDGEHQDPEHPASIVQPAPPQQERGQDHNGYEDGPEADHDVVAVVKERDVVRPVLLREGVEPLYLGVPVLVDEVAEGARHDDGVFDAPVLYVRLADEDYACLPLRFEESLHSGKRDRLVLGDLFAGEVARREEHPEAREYPHNHADFDEDASVLLVPAREQVIGAETGHDEGPAHHRPAHVVRVLRPHPRVEEDGPVVVELDVAVRKCLVADRMLHPGVRRDDEVARGPGTQEDHKGREQVDPLPETLLPEEEKPHERRLEEEREGALHR